MSAGTDRRIGLEGRTARRWLPALVAAVLALLPGAARGRVEESFTYAHDVVWNTVVRLLRVDLGYEISEQDRDNGYILFVAAQNGRTYSGSVEFVDGTGEHGIPVVNVALTVTGLPTSAEDSLIRKLRTKLRNDYGLAPRPVAPPPPAPPPEETDEEDEGEDEGSEVAAEDSAEDEED